MEILVEMILKGRILKREREKLEVRIICVIHDQNEDKLRRARGCPPLWYPWR